MKTKFYFTILPFQFKGNDRKLFFSLNFSLYSLFVLKLEIMRFFPLTRNIWNVFFFSEAVKTVLLGSLFTVTFSKSENWHNFCRLRGTPLIFLKITEFSEKGVNGKFASTRNSVITYCCLKRRIQKWLFEIFH